MPESIETRGADDQREPPLGAVLDFMRLLWAVDHALQSASKRMEATFGMTGPQRLVVAVAAGATRVVVGPGPGRGAERGEGPQVDGVGEPFVAGVAGQDDPAGAGCPGDG